ncbi:MAG: xanthine dehydrogenase family protein molybdopterin-binding subunit [Pseudomonadales bacterium]
MRFGVGQSVPRTEDPRLVTGSGRFTDDVSLPGQLHAAFLRSPYPHGTVARLDVTGAQAAPGVQAVYTGEDLHELGLLPCRARIAGSDGEPAYIPPRPVLARGRVRFVGEPLAAVVADTRAQALAALDLIELDIDELPAVVALGDAAGPDAFVLHPERRGNLCVRYENGDAERAARALAAAPHRVRLHLVNNRVAPSPLEPRACVASYEQGRFTLYNPSQGAFGQQSILARSIFGIPPEQIRVISGDTGGGFGIRGEVYPEACVCLFAARALGRPVKWRGDRSEMFLSDGHGRDNVTLCELGLDDQGRILALAVDTLANLGAYCSAVGPLVPTMAGGRIVGTVYRIPVLHHSVRCLFTNVMPVSAYRGAGRPEACYVMERLLDAAAERLGLAPDEIRRRNFVTPEELPYTNHSGVAMHSGDFGGTLALALEHADWSGFESRRERARAAGRLLGIGLGYYVESSGGGPEEEARVTVHDDGSAEVIVGTYSHGQGHETAYAQILGERLGLDFERIRIVQGDTEFVKFGGGTGGSRSSQMGGIAVLRAGQAVVDRGTAIAAELLQAERAAVRFEAGAYRVADGSREVSLAEVARAAQQTQFGGAPLAETVRYDRGGGFTFPNGCHVAEVAIDPETGVIEVSRYTAVDDCGRLINPLLATGQVHGGAVQGIGQALLEQVIYDESGQLLTGSFMDYAMPRAANMPDLDVRFNIVPEPTNELGVKGIGEGGACGSTPAVVNAVLNALAAAGVSAEARLALQMPLTPEKVWRCLGA